MKIYTILLIIICTILSYGQDHISPYSKINNGFEGEETGILEGVGPIINTYDKWTTQFSQAAEIFSTGGRSGPQYVKFINYFEDLSSSARLHTPTTIFSPNKNYVVQFYYKGNFADSLGKIRGGISWTGDTIPAYGSYHLNPNALDNWKKYSAVISTGDWPSDIGVGIVSTWNYDSIPAEFYIDDFNIYEADEIDTIPPASPSLVEVLQTSNNGELLVTWDMPSDGIDGGGFLVVRKEGSPSTEKPLVNGIYDVSNVIEDGIVVYKGYENSFINSDLKPDSKYYYTVYTFDKAFNYSEGITGGEIPLPVELISFSASFVKNYIQLNWVTASELNNLGFEIQKSSDKINWESIGFVEGKGNSASLNRYEYIDYNYNQEYKYYRLKQTDMNGIFTFSSIVEVGVPLTINLSQNYPNPFNPETTIEFVVDKRDKTTLIVYDLLGNKIEEIFNSTAEPGKVYRINFDGSNLTSGMYYYKLTSGNHSLIKKMILIK